MSSRAHHSSDSRRTAERGSRSTVACLLASVGLHAFAFVWISSAWAGEVGPPRSSDAEPTPEDESTPPQDEYRLGIESSKRATINWLGFADPTPHRASESDIEQAALVMSAPGSPEPPSAPSPAAEAVAASSASAAAEPNEHAETASAQQSEPVSQSDLAASADDADAAAPAGDAANANAASTTASALPSAENAAPVVPDVAMQDNAATDVVPKVSEPDSDGGKGDSPDREAESASETPSESDAPDAAVQEPSDSTEQAEQAGQAEPTETIEAATPADSSQDEPDPKEQPASPPAPQGAQAGADTLAGILSDRESTPTSKPVDMTVRDWGKPAAGEGIRVNPVRPRFPDTLAAFRNVLTAVVLIDFGSDGFVRDVRFEEVTIQRRRVVRNTGSPEADRVLRNSVFNWTATGEQIDALAERGPKAVITVRMDMRITP